MTVLIITSIILGLAFLAFGYLIYFKKKYDLINDFKAEREAGRKGDQYARRVGLIEFAAGIVLLLIGIVLIIFA